MHRESCWRQGALAIGIVTLTTAVARSPYVHIKPDFAALAQQYPKLARHVSQRDGKASIDFQDADAVRALTEALLLVDFKIVAKLPEDRLCPMIPNRLNYVLWLQDIVKETRHVLGLTLRSSGKTSTQRHEKHREGDTEAQTQEDSAEEREEERPFKRARLTSPDLKTTSTSIRGLDIGTGAAAIYPLLMCATDPDIRMVGTDIDVQSLSNARSILNHPQNEATHGLSSRIELKLQQTQDPLITLPSSGPGSRLMSSATQPIYHFTMCNPPFYSSAAEMKELALGKAQPPPTVCTGTEGEMIYQAQDTGGDRGGEVGFVRRLIEESFTRHQAGQTTAWWYTSMLGRLSSVDALLTVIKQEEHTITKGQEKRLNHRSVSWIVHELVQGQTKRWVLGWSFIGVHLVPQHGDTSLNRYRQAWTVKESWLISEGDVKTIMDRLELAVLSVPDIDIVLPDHEVAAVSDHDAQAQNMHIVAWTPSWTRAAQRARSRNRSVVKGIASPTTAAVLCVRFTARAHPKGGLDKQASGTVVQARLLYGHNPGAFDSFCRYFRDRMLSKD